MPKDTYTNRRKPVADRFWPKVNKDGPVPDHCPEVGQCWTWTGARLPDGRGTFSYEGRTRYAHVVAYILTTGHEPPPETPFITHACDGIYIGCVRPAHLMPDTHRGNMAQMTERSRSTRGTRHGAAKLSDAVVGEIRERYAAGGISQRALGLEYGVTNSLISMIIQGKRWKHLAGRREKTGNTRGTAAKGARHWHAKFTEVQVIDIRARYLAGCISQKDLAVEFNVRQTTISEIVRGKRWGHVK